jgi:diguanylate cyclase (GGDEF)-like protein
MEGSHCPTTDPHSVPGQAELARFPIANPNPVLAIQENGCILFANQASGELLTFWGVEAGGLVPSAWLAPVQEVLADGEAQEFEAQLGERVFSFNLVPDPQAAIVHFYAADVTDSSEARTRLWFLAYHDPLTGLPNRSLFLDRLHQRLAGDAGDPAVVYLGLDRFKYVVSALGHDQGDTILQAVAGVLSKLFPEQTVSRLYGDEFAVLLHHLDDAPAAEAELERLRQAFDEPLACGWGEVGVSVSAGVALSSTSTVSADDLLQDAHGAMVRAKAGGPDSGRVFDDAMRTEFREGVALEADLKAAIGRGDPAELAVHFQPLIGLDQGACVGYEALVRWFHPEQGLISPGRFIPLAEESGLIHRLGRHVLTQAAAQAAAWNAERSEPVTINVNLAPQQVMQPGIADEVEEILVEQDCRPEWIKLELTESALAGDVDWTRRSLQRLRDLGCALCIDDFGTGYSSLSYLHRLPFDCLKIDRSFVLEARQAGRSRELVRAIVALADNLGLTVVAEGVEDAAQAELLAGMGCEQAQGFYYAPALAASEAIAWLPPRDA